MGISALSPDPQPAHETALSFLLQPRNPPVPTDPNAVRVGLERWRERAAELAGSEDRDSAIAALECPGPRALIEGIVAHSPYLTRELLREQAFVAAALRDGIDAATARIRRDFEAIDPADGVDAVMKALRVAKRRSAVAVALADIAGLWDFVQVTGAISETAERGAQRVAPRQACHRLHE